MAHRPKTTIPKTPASADVWKLKLLVEDHGARVTGERFRVQLAPAVDRPREPHVCIGSGATRAAALIDAETELRGALTLLKDAEAG